ncbi:hypothetical protein M2326_001869 [Flavobacterium sp. 7A]|nr:hypothetical protein [Flavobacterium sp. 7A]
MILSISEISLLNNNFCVVTQRHTKEHRDSQRFEPYNMLILSKSYT